MLIRGGGGEGAQGDHEKWTEGRGKYLFIGPFLEALKDTKNRLLWHILDSILRPTQGGFKKVA